MSNSPMRSAFQTAVRNIAAWGDTDVFPFPVENHVFYDRTNDVVKLLSQMDAQFGTWSADRPPDNESALAMVGYTAFRWVTQIDPLWNAYLLGLVIAVAPELEAARIPRDQEIVFSYRYEPDTAGQRLFAEGAWPAFNKRSIELAGRHSFVVACDISDFYARIPHHPLENQLLGLRANSTIAQRIDDVLNLFSGGRSYGLPVGGPAARLLSEISLNHVDRLLLAEGIIFCRFADDYHLFADSRERAYDALRFLTEKLLVHQGLTLQRAKTRILSAKDFLSASPFNIADDAEQQDETEEERHQRSFLSLSLRYDPYSPTAEEDYESLRDQIEHFDILGMLARELSKSRIHAPLTRRLLQALRYLDESAKNAAAQTLVDNVETLTPVLPNVLRVLADIYGELRPDTQATIGADVRDMISRRRYYIAVPVNLAYAVRLLGHGTAAENSTLLAQIYNTVPPFIKRDIMLIMGRWRETWFLSDRLREYSNMTGWVQRAFVISSYQLADEGLHWRQRNRKRFSPMERLVDAWAEERAQADPNWTAPT